MSHTFFKDPFYPCLLNIAVLAGLVWSQRAPDCSFDTQYGTDAIFTAESWPRSVGKPLHEVARHWCIAVLKGNIDSECIIPFQHIYFHSHQRALQGCMMKLRCHWWRWQVFSFSFSITASSLQSVTLRRVIQSQFFHCLWHVISATLPLNVCWQTLVGAPHYYWWRNLAVWTNCHSK